MGQRHQVFLIARVCPHGSTVPKYRCIAGYHHQWCYGSRPLRAARRCITAIKQKENAEILREEMRAIDGVYGTYGCEPKLPNMPCPFASYLLCLNWDMDFALAPYNSTIFSGNAHEGCILEASNDCWDFGMLLFLATHRAIAQLVLVTQTTTMGLQSSTSPTLTHLRIASCSHRASR